MNPSPLGGGGFTGGAGDLVGGIMSWWGPPKMLLYCENNCVLNCLLGHLAVEKTGGADERVAHRLVQHGPSETALSRSHR